MCTIFFDFDSTLISCESLEEIIKTKLGNESKTIEKISKITQMGMDGQISFIESLQRRLEYISLSKSDVVRFGRQAEKYITVGMQELIQDLHKKNVDIHIVSGGFKEAIFPVAEVLNISPDNIHAVQLIWDSQGNFKEIDDDDKYSQSKVEGIKFISKNWPKPKIAIGDGSTDLALFEHGLVDHFILFTQHVLRSELMNRSANVAGKVKELVKLLEQWV